MKNEGLHPYLARIPPDLHSTLKGDAKTAALSMSAHLLSLLVESLKQFPVIETMPPFQLAHSKSFCARLPTALHEDLLRAAAAADTERSLNLEILGRLLVMTSPSKQDVLNAWSVLNELNASVNFLFQACPQRQLDAVHDLRGALDRFECQLRSHLSKNAP
jgi:predicted HicB family RNase H-like nuclease